MRVKGLIGLSESGSLLYRRLQEGCTEEELIRTLLAEYDIDAATAREDTRSFLDQLRRMGILIED